MEMMLIQIRFQPYTHSLLSRAEVKRKTFQGQRELFFRETIHGAINLLLYGLFLQLRNFSGGFHEDFYPLIYHSQRPKLSIKHLIGPKVITLIDCKVHLHKIHREHMKIQRFQVDPQFFYILKKVARFEAFCPIGKIHVEGIMLYIFTNIIYV